MSLHPVIRHTALYPRLPSWCPRCSRLTRWLAGYPPPNRAQPWLQAGAVFSLLSRSEMARAALLGIQGFLDILLFPNLLPRSLIFGKCDSPARVSSFLRSLDPQLPTVSSLPHDR